MASSDASVNGWEREIATLAAEWTAATSISQDRVVEWSGLINEYAAEVSELKRNGLWVSGPIDVMTAMGRHRDELAHSNVLAWLLNPTGRHGLGTRLLQSILDAGWPSPEYGRLALDSVVIERETMYEDRRADVIVRMDDAILVVENKVDAPESADQCEDAYRHWIHHADDVRFLLLSPLGHAPFTTHSQEAADLWRSMSYSGLAVKLRELLQQLDAGPARNAVQQYVLAVDSLSSRREEFVIRSGGGHVDR